MYRLGVTLTVVGLMALLGGCGSDDEPATTEAAAPTRTEAKAASPLEGTWQTAPISPRQVDAVLRRDGLSEWVADFREDTPIPATTTLILDLHDGEWDLYGKRPGQPREEIDYDAEYFVKGDRVEKVHGTGLTTYRWSIDGDTLKLRWVSTTEPPAEGIPDEVYSRALYMTRPFTRQE